MTDIKLNVNQLCCLAKRANCIPLCQEHGQQVERNESSPLFGTWKVMCAVQSHLSDFYHRKHIGMLNKFHWGLQRLSRTGTRHVQEESEGFIHSKEEKAVWMSLLFAATWWESTEKVEPASSQRCKVTGQEDRKTQGGTLGNSSQILREKTSRQGWSNTETDAQGHCRIFILGYIQSSACWRPK